MPCQPVVKDDSAVAFVAIIVVFCILMTVALIGNFLVGLVFCKVRAMRTNVNYFIVNMALSDLLFPLVVWPRFMVKTFTSGRWLIGGPLGNFLCKFVFYVPDVSTVVSIISLVLIAIERFLAVVFPLKVRKFTPTLRASCVVITWIVAIMIQSPLFYAFKLKENINRTICEYDWSPAFDHKEAVQIFSLTIFVAFWLAPLIAVSILYTFIAISLRRNSVPAQNRKKSEQRQQKIRKVFLLAVVVWAAFVLCWAPFHVFVLLNILSNWCKSKIQKLQYPAVFLAYSSTAVNPIILFIFSQNYRKGLAKTFTWRRQSTTNRRTKATALNTSSVKILVL